MLKSKYGEHIQYNLTKYNPLTKDSVRMVKPNNMCMSRVFKKNSLAYLSYQRIAITPHWLAIFWQPIAAANCRSAKENEKNGENYNFLNLMREHM